MFNKIEKDQFIDFFNVKLMQKYKVDYNSLKYLDVYHYDQDPENQDARVYCYRQMRELLLRLVHDI